MMDFQKRILHVQDWLKGLNVEALVLVTFDSPRSDGNNKNVDYLSGFTGSTGVVVVGLTEALLVVDGRYIERAAAESPLRVVRSGVADRRTPSYAQYVLPGLDALGVSPGGRVAFEAARVPVAMAEAWTKTERAMFVPTTHLVESLRQFKDADEVALIEGACKKTCDVWVECSEKIVGGMTERAVQRLFDNALYDRGASGNSFPTIVASGPNSASPHHATSERAIRAGEPVTVDFGGVFQNGYCSDLTRAMFVPGADPDAKLVEIYKTVLGANAAAREALKVGMTWKEYDKVARDYIVAKGYGEYFGHGLGHSLGLEAHDPFNYAESTFEIGTVMTDEPGIYVPGLGGVRIEDDLVLTASGVRSLTPAPYLAL